jgi:hypothetical protein
MVADKSCGLLLGFFEHLLIARHETSPRASIFELAWMLNKVPRAEGWRFALDQAEGRY